PPRRKSSAQTRNASSVADLLRTRRMLQDAPGAPCGVRYRGALRHTARSSSDMTGLISHADAVSFAAGRFGVDGAWRAGAGRAEAGCLGSAAAWATMACGPHSPIGRVHFAGIQYAFASSAWRTRRRSETNVRSVTTTASPSRNTLHLPETMLSKIDLRS